MQQKLFLGLVEMRDYFKGDRFQEMLNTQILVLEIASFPTDRMRRHVRFSSHKEQGIQALQIKQQTDEAQMLWNNGLYLSIVF